MLSNNKDAESLKIIMILSEMGVSGIQISGAKGSW
jgi:hypothetical protein